MNRRTTLLAAPALLAMPSARAATPAQEGLIQGFSPSRLARFRPAMAREIERQTFAGAITHIQRRGEVVHSEIHGHLDPARTRAMRPDALFLLASMTKPITSVMAMMLVEEGVIALRDPIGVHLPELRALQLEVRRPGAEPELVAPAAQPTVQDLLRHTSGHIYAASAPAGSRIGRMQAELDIEQRNAPMTTADFLRHLATIPLAHAPSSTFHYSICTDILGVLCERATRTRFDRLVKTRILDPLGMADTAWFVRQPDMARVAMGMPNDPLVAQMWASYRIDQDPGDTAYFKGGAGMVSTTADYAKFCQMILDGGRGNGVRLLSPATVRFMLSDHTLGMAGSTAASTGPGYGFGLGFAVRRQEGMGVAPGTVGDAMWAGAWGVSFTIDPQNQLFGMLMANAPTPRVHTRMLFKNLMYGALVG